MLGEQHRHDGGADATGEAGREVDLAQQQDEDQAHRDDGDLRALLEQVGEVAVGEEAAVRDAEDDAGDDEAGDGRQRTDVAAAHLREVFADVAAEVVLRDRRRRRRDGLFFHRGHACAPFTSITPPLVAAAPAVAGRQPELAAATGGDQFNNLGERHIARLDLRGHLPEVERRDAVGHREHVVHVVRDQHDG